jgi:hypothetical protein
MEPLMATLDDKMQNPAKCYKSPADVLIDDALTRDEKKQVLAAWRLDAERLSESSNEGMSGGENARLREVALAQHSLDSLSKASV